MSPRPPQRIYNFMEWACPNYLWEGIAGDLEEQFYDDLEVWGAKKARRNYFWNAIRFLHPSILLRNKLNYSNNNTIMISNYIKVARRNMARHKLFTFINAFGLSIALAFSILIYLFIKDEQSFDRFHTNIDNIYRIEEKVYNAWDPNPEEPFSYSAWLQTGLAPALKDEISQVKYATRFNAGGDIVITVDDEVFSAPLGYADHDFFRMFTFEVLAGNPDEFLTADDHIILTPEMADKLYGTRDVLGKTLTVDNWGVKSYKVVGLVAAPPANSSLQFKMLANQTNRPFYERNMENWQNFNSPTFVQLHNNSDLADFQQGLDGIVEKYMSKGLEERVERYNIPADIDPFDYQYKNLADIHLDTEVSWTNSSDPQYSYILTALAILILLIACINYISLSLTTSAARKIEVGVRKAIGAQQNQLIGQFTVESVLTAFISLVLGIALMLLFLPGFNEFTRKSIELHAEIMLQITALALVLSLVIGFLAGSYPAFFLSRFKPATALKGRFSNKMKTGFTKPLVILQFALSAFLIISSVIMYQQMSYVTTKDLGFDQEQVLVVPTQLGWTDESDQFIERLRQRLMHEGFVERVGGTSSSFNQGWSRNGYTIDGENKSAYTYVVDPEYVPTLKLDLVAGRNFDPAIASDSTALIVNEALVADMGWENPLDEYLNWREDSLGPGAKIIGVAKDYHFLSLNRTIEPLLLNMNNGHLLNALIRLKPGNTSEQLASVERVYKELAPDKPFEYTFMDEDIARQYASYQRWMKIMGLATLFAILISCLGLFGLAGINAINRTKEIGIRKVFGADVSTIFILMNRQFVLLAIAAFVIAAPLSWYIMTQWLEKFEYSITIGWQVFAISIGLGLLVALFTVTYHGLKAAWLNPASTLKYE